MLSLFSQLTRTILLLVYEDEFKFLQYPQFEGPAVQIIADKLSVEFTFFVIQRHLHNVAIESNELVQ